MTILMLKKPCKKCGGLEASTRGDECNKCAYDRRKLWRMKNKTYHKDIKAKGWYKKNPYSRSSVVIAIRHLKAALLLNIMAADMPQELIEIKRLQMQLKHAIKERINTTQ